MQPETAAGSTAGWGLWKQRSRTGSKCERRAHSRKRCKLLIYMMLRVCERRGCLPNRFRGGAAWRGGLPIWQARKVAKAAEMGEAAKPQAAQSAGPQAARAL